MDHGSAERGEVRRTPSRSGRRDGVIDPECVTGILAGHGRERFLSVRQITSERG